MNSSGMSHTWSTGHERTAVVNSDVGNSTRETCFIEDVKVGYPPSSARAAEFCALRNRLDRQPPPRRSIRPRVAATAVRTCCANSLKRQILPHN